MSVLGHLNVCTLGAAALQPPASIYKQMKAGGHGETSDT